MSTLKIGAVPGESGTTVERVEPAPARVESPFGRTLIAGGFPWGKIDEVVEHTGQGDYAAQRATPVEGDYAAVAAEHFLQRARGAGRLLTLRLADGNQLAAYKDVYGRDAERSFLAKVPYPLPTRVLRVSGGYAGTRGGWWAYRQGTLADLAAAFDAAAGTFATGETMRPDEWRGARLYLQGVSRSYVIRGNTSAGVLSIEVPTGDPGPTGAGTWEAILATTNADGVSEGLAFRVDASQRNPGTEFALTLVDLRSGAEVDPRYPSLSLDPTLEAYVEEKVSRDLEDGNQHYVDAAAEAVGDPNDDEIQPANWVGLVKPGSSGATLQLQTVFWERSVQGAGNAYLDPSFVTYDTDDVLRCRAVCTFTSATDFDVVYEDWHGDTVLADGISDALDSVVAGNGRLPDFRLLTGTGAMQAGDTITVYFNGVPPQVAGAGYLYPHATAAVAGDLRTALPVRARTPTTITVAGNVDLVADHGLVVPTAPTSTSPTAETYDMSVAGNRDFKYDLNGEGEVTITSTLTGAAETAADLAADLDALAAAVTPQRLTFDDDGAGRVVVTAVQDYGDDAELVIKTAGMGVILGYVIDTTVTGTSGSVVALAYADELQFGKDGHLDLASTTEHADAWLPTTSPVNQILRRNLGLVKCAMPGVTDATAQNAAIAYCAEVGFMFRGEVPADRADEVAAAAWVRDNLTGDENRTLAFDTYGYPRVKPFDGADQALPMSGAFLGAEAELAADVGGYHEAAAGTKVDVGPIFRALASTPAGSRPARKDEATLNAAGIQPVQQVGAAIYCNGDENSADAYKGTVWKHKVESVLHLMHLLIQVGDQFTWEPNDPRTRRAVAAALTATLLPLFDAGWFRREEGQGFFDVVSIAAGDDENPPSVTVLGELRAVVTISGIVDTVKRVVFTLGTGGVTASVA